MTVTFLGTDWLERTLSLAADQPEQPGASVRVQFVVTGGPGAPEPDKGRARAPKDKRESRYYWVVEDGRVVGCGPDGLDDAEMTWTATYQEAVEMMKGELDPGAAFMRGTLKVAGDMGKVLTLLPLLATEPYRRLTSALAADTTFS